MFIGAGSVSSVFLLDSTANVINTFQFSIPGDNTLYVGGNGPGNYSNIKDAISDANNGDTIFVFNGIYSGTYNINKAINLIGENKKFTKVNCDTTGFIITHKDVTISGFTFMNAPDENIGFPPNAGVRINADDCILVDNRFINNYCGVMVLESNGNLIEENEIFESKWCGIQLYIAEVNCIKSNFIHDNGIGIVMDFGASINSVYHNNFVDNVNKPVEKCQGGSCDNFWYAADINEGNYWHDFEYFYPDVKDANHDGIWDDSYYITGGNEDKYPFVEMNGWIEIAHPDLHASGTLSWTDIKPASIVDGVITIENIGDSGSLLNWEIESYPSWGSWSFEPEHGTGLTPEDDSVTIEVSVNVPNIEESSFSGEVIIKNSENESDFDIITVSLSTPKNIEQIFYDLLEKFLDFHSLIIKFNDM